MGTARCWWRKILVSLESRVYISGLSQTLTMSVHYSIAIANTEPKKVISGRYHAQPQKGWIASPLSGNGQSVYSHFPIVDINVGDEDLMWVFAP